MSEMNIELAVTSPVQSPTEPVSISEALEYLGYAGDEYTATSIVQGLIGAARELAESFQWRMLRRATYVATMDCFPCDDIDLSDPLVSVTTFRYRDYEGNWTTLVENTDYIVDTAKHPGEVMPPYGKTWPSAILWPSSAVEITYVAGLLPEDVPFAVKVAMKQLISGWYNNRLPFEAGKLIADNPQLAHALSYGSLRGPR